MPDRSNPFADIEQFFERMNQSLGDVGMTPTLHQLPVDVAETDTEIVVTADLPGFKKESITISVADRELTIEAERDEASETGDEAGDVRYVRRERTQQALTRTVRLPDAVEEGAATASYQNGVLTVTLPREVVEDDDSHRIDIS